MMFDFETPYLDMYRTQRFNFKSKPIVLHRRTCPICDKKLVNVYYSNQLEKYICKNCMDKLLGAKGGASDGKLV